MKVLVSDALPLDEGLVEEVQVHLRVGLSPEELAAIIGGYDGLIVRSTTQVTSELLRRAEGLQVIGRAGVGVDNIDLETASRRGIVVVNAPEANIISAAEHALGMMLALARHIPRSDRQVRQRVWDRKLLGSELAGKTLGLVGFGRIGQLVAARAKAFGMGVLAYDPYIPAERAAQLGVELVSLADLLPRSDYLSVHVALTKETQGMIGPAELRLLPRGARVINCARGGIVQELALAQALGEGHLAGAALDVFEHEPPWESPLLALEQCVFTAHLGGSTAEAQARAAREILRGVVDVLKGRAVRSAVNLPPLDADALKVLGPYLTLAEKLGKLLSQLVKGRAAELAIEYSGEFPREPRILGMAALKGLLDPILNEVLSFVAAPIVAKERGIRVTESVAPQPRDYLNLLTLVVTADGRTRAVSGTTFGGEPRIVHLDGYRVDAVPEGHMFILKNVDVPGVIGRIATLLGENSINIAQVTWGRDRPGGTAMTAINVDQSPPEGLLERIRSLPQVLSAEQVAL